MFDTIKQLSSAVKPPDNWHAAVDPRQDAEVQRLQRSAREHMQRYREVAGRVTDARQELGTPATLAERRAALRRRSPRDLKALRRFIRRNEEIRDLERLEDEMIEALTACDDIRRPGGELDEALSRAAECSTERAGLLLHEAPDARPNVEEHLREINEALRSDGRQRARQYRGIYPGSIPDHQVKLPEEL